MPEIDKVAEVEEELLSEIERLCVALKKISEDRVYPGSGTYLDMFAQLAVQRDRLQKIAREALSASK